MTTSVPRHHRHTFADYVHIESFSPVKHEFFDGAIFAMAGGTPEHAALAMSVGAALVAATRGGPCRVHSADLNVCVLATGLATYPDVTVVCGPYQHHPESGRTVINPRLVVEITSESTEEYDRGEKLESYKLIPSVEAIVLVSHRERLIEVIERAAGGAWRRVEARRGGRARVEALACDLDVDDIYTTAGVT